MKTIKVAEATGATLDWLVAKCEGKVVNDRFRAHQGLIKGMWGAIRYKPSTNWAQGGPIVEQHIAAFTEESDDQVRAHAKPYLMAIGVYRHQAVGTTKLIAAMRCYVASKLGETVEVPEELG